MPKKVRKTALVKFYDDDFELHKRLKYQAVAEEKSMQDIIIKACKYYLEAVKENKVKTNIIN